jgi:hypothetical protein
VICSKLLKDRRLPFAILDERKFYRVGEATPGTVTNSDRDLISERMLNIGGGSIDD